MKSPDRRDGHIAHEVNGPYVPDARRSARRQIDSEEPGNCLALQGHRGVSRPTARRYVEAHVGGRVYAERAHRPQTPGLFGLVGLRHQGVALPVYAVKSRRRPAEVVRISYPDDARAERRVHIARRVREIRIGLRGGSIRVELQILARIADDPQAVRHRVEVRVEEAPVQKRIERPD